MKGLILLLILLSGLKGYGQSQDKFALVDSLLATYYRLGYLNGNVLISEKGQPLYEASFGKAVFEWDVDNTKKTRFKVASISKGITLALCFRLCQEGKLDLNASLNTWLPDFPNADKITIDQLLSHRAGLVDHRNIRELYDNIYGMSRLSRGQMLDVFKDSTLLFEPGTAWRYSNFGYNVMAVVAEKVVGTSYDSLLEKYIFEPAGMPNSTTLESGDLVENLAFGYEWTYGGIKPAQYYDGSMMPGAGSVISTPRDLLSFYRAIDSGELLNEEYREKFNWIFLKDEYGSAAGYEARIFYQPTGTGDSTAVLYRAGNHFGTHALSYAIGEKDAYLIMTLNMRSEKLFEIADNILNILFNQPFSWPKESYARRLAADIRIMGWDAALQQFYRNKEKHETNWAHQPRDLNRLGYYFLGQGRASLAVEVFKLNLQYFADDGNLYDSLGEAYIAVGDQENARKNLLRAIELDPTNEHAKDLLKSLGEER